MEIHTLKLAQALQARGHGVVVLQFGDPIYTPHNFPTMPGLELRTVKLDRAVERVGLARWYRLFRGIACEVGVFAKGWTTVGNLQLDLAARLAFKRFVTIEHLTPPRPPPRMSRRHFGGLIPGVGLGWRASVYGIRLRSFGPAQIITVSQGIADELIEGYGFPRGKIVPVPNGIDPQRFAPDPAARADVRRAWGIPADDLVFGSVGRLWNYQKGLDIAVDLFARLAKEHPHRSMWYGIVGEGPDRTALEEQARDSGAGDRIFFPGHTHRPWEAFAAIDVFLMPSRFEGIGLSLMEAMATECCPIAMGVGGITEVVSLPSVGWLVPAGDREAYYRAMVAAAHASTEQRQRIGRLARQRIVERFNAEQQYGKMVELIERT